MTFTRACSVAECHHSVAAAVEIAGVGRRDVLLAVAVEVGDCDGEGVIGGADDVGAGSPE